MIEKNDFRAFLRLIALAVTNDSAVAEKAVEWAYSGQEKPRRATPQKKEDKSEAVMRIYELYPASTTRPEGNKVALRSSKDKATIERLLKTKTEEELAEAIKRYVAETNPLYLKMLCTFLNNLPDFGNPTPPKPQEQPEGNNFFDDPELAAAYHQLYTK